MIHCARCQSVNNADLRFCQNCHKDLLPGEGLLTRIGYLIGAALLTALGVFMLIRISSGEIPVNLDCALGSPIYWGIMVVAAPILGLSQALKRTPDFKRYLDRAQRHIELDPEQSLADLNQALELAPSKERGGILKERARLYEKLGHQERAVRDKLASTQEEGAFQGGELIAGLTGVDSDSLVNELRAGTQKSLLRTGKALAVGYCSKCKDAVRLDENLHCLSHPKSTIQDVRFAIEEEVERTRSEVLTNHEQTARRVRVRRAVALVVLTTICGAVIYFANSPSTNPGTTPTSTRAVVEDYVTQVPESPKIFDDHGFVFQYAGDWRVIQESDIDSLLDGSLEGMDLEEAEYIGGVYYGGLNNCPGCAQIVIVVLRNESISGPLTDEQFEAAEQANREQMGARSLYYERVVMGSLTGTESVHVGRSGDSQIWEFILLPPQPGLIYLFSMSAFLDDYPRFDSQFQQAVDTLKVSTGSDEATDEELAITPAPTTVVEFTAIVLNKSINLRAGPGKSYDILGSLEKGQEILITGRNEQGDWLCFDTWEGGEAWVYGPLVSLDGDPLDLPVEDIQQ